jgi:hypothetical protein
MNDAIYCRDLLQCGSKLINFAEAAITEKNRATLVKLFYERLREATVVDYIFDDFFDEQKCRFAIYEGENAVGKYLVLSMPQQSTPVKTLNAIRNFGECLIQYFRGPIGNAISKDRIDGIMQYLDKQYEFTNKVFSDQKAIFSILDYSHTEFNSECMAAFSESKVMQHIFLYHMKTNNGDTPLPETVFFHELGHVIHAKYFGSVDSVPENILSFLKQLCMPNIDMCSPKEQIEVFADIISIGLMYNSPFDEYDSFSYMHEDDKKAFKMLVEKMLSRI